MIIQTEMTYPTNAHRPIVVLTDFLTNDQHVHVKCENEKHSDDSFCLNVKRH